METGRESPTAWCVEPTGHIRTDGRPPAILPGSFNPLHFGHRRLAAVAAARLGVPVHFELSVTNVDKPELPKAEIDRRIAQFAGVGTVWVTRAATFVEKAALFPGAAFVLGWDTAVRLIDPTYHGGAHPRDATLSTLRAAGCRFVVGGRVDAAGAFRVWDRALLSDEFASLFEGIVERDFRADVSSTALRG